MIVFDDVHKRFGEQSVLRGVSFQVAAGGLHFIIGKSGAGKSVLIKQVVGLLRPDAGRILLGGQDLGTLDEAGFVPVRRRCQLVFQAATLFDGWSVLENVAVPIHKRFAISMSEAMSRARAALEQVQAVHLAERLPSELSPGLKKRIAIARALALAPEILLYDEPTTSLDPVAARRMDRLLADVSKRGGVTSVVVSHDLVSVRSIATRVTFLHDGRVYFEGTPDELFACDDPEVNRFVRAVVRAPTS